MHSRLIVIDYTTSSRILSMNKDLSTRITKYLHNLTDVWIAKAK